MALLCVTLLGCAGNSEDPTRQIQQQTQQLPISIIQSIEAGEAAIVTLGPIDVPDGTAGQVMAVGSYGVERFEGRFVDGVAEVVLSAEFTQRAGHLSLFGSVEGYAGETTLTIVAGKPIGPLTTLVGPRSIIAGNQAWTTAVVVPFDQFYNPVPDNTELILEASRPDGTFETYAMQTQNLIAWQKLYSSMTAGRSRLATHTDDAFGPEATFDETPGEPVAFEISADKTIIPADGVQLIDLRTEPLVDRHANVLLDGTLVNFLVADSDGTHRSIPAYTLDGVAEITIQAAKLAGTATVQAVSSQVVSQPLTLSFVANDVRVPLRLRATGDVIRVTAGPILGTLQQFLPDGTEARFAVASETFEGQAQTQVIEDGFVSAEFRLDALPIGKHNLIVIVGDSSGTATFNILPKQSETKPNTTTCVGTASYQICFDNPWLRFR